MGVNRKALGLAIGAFAAVAASLTAVPASAMDVTGEAYYAARDGEARQSRSERRAARAERRDRDRRDRDARKDRDGDYSREVDRSRGDGSVGRTTTVTNEETGNSVTRERTTSRDAETGAITHSDEITGSGGQTWSSSTTGVKTDDGRTHTTTVTGTDGDVRTRSVDVSKDAGSGTATRDVTVTGADGDTRARTTTRTETEDGFTRTTEFEGGATTQVDATYDEETGEWEREVTRARGDGGAAGDDGTLDGSSTVELPQADVAAEPTKN
jgi:hypothetical protein